MRETRQHPVIFYPSLILDLFTYVKTFWRYNGLFKSIKYYLKEQLPGLVRRYRTYK